MLSFEFSEEQEQFRRALAAFSREHLLPGYSQRARLEAYPWKEHQQLAEMGVLGIGLPEEYGGSGQRDFIALGIAAEEIGYGDVNLASSPTQTGLIADLIAAAGTAPVKQRYLPSMIAGTQMVALALTEPDAGSDAAALRTTATRVDGGWTLSGEKTSISLVQFATASIVFARQPGTKGAAGVSAFLVEHDQPGVRIAPFHDMGLLPIGRGSLALEGVFVPDEHLLGAEGRGFHLVMRNFDFSRATIALQCLGAARASLEEASSYMRERTTFGRPLASYQGLSFQIAEHYTYLEASRLQCYWTLWLRKEEKPHTAQAAMCKWWAPRVAARAIETAMLVHGHGGWSDDSPHQARLRDVMGYFIADGTAEIQKLIIGREYIGVEVMAR